MSKYKKRSLILIFSALTLLAFSFVLISWKNRVSDPRVDHRLFWLIAVLHIAVVIFLIVSAILLYRHWKSGLQKRDQVCLIVLSCCVVLLLSFLLFGYDTLIQDPYDYAEYQVLQIPDSDIHLLVQEYSGFRVMGAHVYLGDDGTAGRYLGRIDYNRDRSAGSLIPETYQIVNRGDGSITIKWIKQESPAGQALWDEKTFYIPDLS